MKPISVIVTTIIITGLITSSLAQLAPGKFSYKMTRGVETEPIERLSGNVIVDIRPDSSDSTVWFSTGSGVSHFDPPPDSVWRSWTESHGIGKGGVSALVVTDSVIWLATAFDTTVGISGAGGGLSYSRDHGQSWTHFAQPVDPRVPVDETGFSDSLGYWPTTTHVDNITYDLALSPNYIWITSKGGGLRRHPYSAEFDKVDWEVITPNGAPFHPAMDLNHIAFAVVYDNGMLWTGSADGIGLSRDEGETWENFNHRNAGISGNFITSMAVQNACGHTILWATTWRAEGSTEYYGVSYSDDGGASWNVTLEGIRGHNIAFDDSVVYIADDRGLWKSDDWGQTWLTFPPIRDHITGIVLHERKVYSVLVYLGTLWVGTVDGLASSPDGGIHWTVYRAYQPTRENGTPATYAYPNPFSPTRYAVVRFQYDLDNPAAVTLKIYDFSMTLVKTVVDGAHRPAGDLFEEWDGRNDRNDLVANGTYFYQLKASGREHWGKVVILD
jgi:hypothetical protein